MGREEKRLSDHEVTEKAIRKPSLLDKMFPGRRKEIMSFRIKLTQEMLPAGIELDALTTNERTYQAVFYQTTDGPEIEVTRVHVDVQKCRCGETKGLEWRVDPCAEEIHGSTDLEWMCQDCIYQSLMDI